MIEHTISAVATSGGATTAVAFVKQAKFQYSTDSPFVFATITDPDGNEQVVNQSRHQRNFQHKLTAKKMLRIVGKVANRSAFLNIEFSVFARSTEKAPLKWEFARFDSEYTSIRLNYQLFLQASSVDDFLVRSLKQ